MVLRAFHKPLGKQKNKALSLKISSSIISQEKMTKKTRKLLSAHNYNFTHALQLSSCEILIYFSF